MQHDSLVNVVKKLNGNLTSLVRMSNTVMAVKVITRTPVKTGTARASWNPTIGQPKPRNVYINEHDPYAARNQISSVMNTLQVGDRFSLANGLPYIESLESGSSKQAPAGMVKTSTAEWQAVVNEVAGKLNK